MATYKYVRLDNVSATRDGSLLRTIKVTEDLENGEFVAVGDLKTGEREIHEYSTTIGEGAVKVGIVCTPELEYDESKPQGIENFINKAGDLARVDILTVGDIFSIGGTNNPDDIDLTSNLTAVYQHDEVVGRYTYHVYEVQEVTA